MFEKLHFTATVQSIIAKHPDWAGDTIEAISKGVKEAVMNWENDMGKMAALMILQRLEIKGQYKMTDEDNQRALNYLSKYFNIESLK